MRCGGGVLLVFFELALGGEVALPELLVLAAGAIALRLQGAALFRQGRDDAGVRARFREGTGGVVDRALPGAEQRDENLRPHTLEGGELLPERLPRADRFIELAGDVEVGGPGVKVFEAGERLLDQRLGRTVLEQLGLVGGDRRLEVPRSLGPGTEHGRETVAARGVVLQPAVEIGGLDGGLHHLAVDGLDSRTVGCAHATLPRQERVSEAWVPQESWIDTATPPGLARAWFARRLGLWPEQNT